MSAKDIDMLIRQSLAEEKGGLALPLKKSNAAVPRPKERKKHTILLTTDDQDNIKEILELLYESTGERYNFGDALRIGLELCPRNPTKILKAFEKARGKDRRLSKQ